MSKSTKKLIAVVGPTGSGKTELAVKLAQVFDGVIISADSRQIFRRLDVGTNKVGENGHWNDQPARIIEQVPQLMIDIAAPEERFTLTDWLEKTRILTEQIWQNDQLPIVVGGTGLYVTALLEGYQPGGEAPELRVKLEKLPLSELQDRAAHLDLNDSDYQNPSRIIRALEQEVAGASQKIAVDFEALVLQPTVELENLYQRSDDRYEQIFDALIFEVKTLMADGVSTGWLESIGLDYRYASYFLTNKMSRQKAILEYQKAARAYIRRQLTWWRHHGPVIPVGNFEQASAEVRQFLKDHPNPVM